MKNFARKFSVLPKSCEIALIDGARIPFTTANTVYKQYMSYDLARYAIKGLVNRNEGIEKELDGLIWGTVVQEGNFIMTNIFLVRTSNLAREAALGAGIPSNIPAFTVSQACISANRAIASGVEKIMSGHGNIFLCGGSETFSDVPIRFSKPLRERMLVANKAIKKGPGAVFSLLRGLKFKDLAPEPPAIKNFSTDEVMGHSSDRLAARFGVSRGEQDEFALASHMNAAKAHEQGFYQDEIVPVQGKINENGIRGDSTLEGLSKLKAAFIKPNGTHTAANSSFLTDGAAAVVIANRDVAQAKGLPVKALIRDIVFVGVDPYDSMLLGPGLAIQKLLSRTKDSIGSQLSVEDIGVVELHEAFAGQVLANMRYLEQKGIKIDLSKVNQWGGSLSIGHPFGATGARLVTTASNRLKYDGKQYALLAACADGGLGHACLIENI